MYISTELWLFVSVCVRVYERNKLVSSEVTSSEEDVPEEIIVEDSCSEHSNRSRPYPVFIDSIRFIVNGLYKNVSGMILVIFRDRNQK